MPEPNCIALTLATLHPPHKSTSRPLNWKATVPPFVLCSVIGVKYEMVLRIVWNLPLVDFNALLSNWSPQSWSGPELLVPRFIPKICTTTISIDPGIMGKWERTEGQGWLTCTNILACEKSPEIHWSVSWVKLKASLMFSQWNKPIFLCEACILHPLTFVAVWQVYENKYFQRRKYCQLFKG